MFKKRFFGKWVLAGEYSVLRAFPALAYPLASHYMDFYYESSEKPLKIIRGGKYQAGLEFAVSPLLEKALKMSGKKRADLKGLLKIEGFIPFGAGLGASSAISAGTASLCLYKNWIGIENLQSFAQGLEDFFHGKSSGMDVAVALENKAILYQKGKKLKTLPKFETKPLLFLSYSGARASTLVGVSKVRKLFDENWTEAKQIDSEMGQAVALCLKAMREKDTEKGQGLLSSALSKGESCFRKWKLVSYDLERHIDRLKSQGALAAKPTGSGLGGHVISLWAKPPPEKTQKKLIQLEV